MENLRATGTNLAARSGPTLIILVVSCVFHFWDVLKAKLNTALNKR